MRQPIVFGNYLLLQRISVGGMAEIFKAKSFGAQGFEKILAIKRILPSMAEDEEFIQMFVDEAKISGQLSHPNIAQIFELGELEGSYFIAMEHVWGKDALQIQNRYKRYQQTMPLPMAAHIVCQVCEGLDYAHRKLDDNGSPLHIVHRDVSPQNVLVSYSGEVKLIDFGIAKARSRSSKTQAGVLKGKFGYMSPEQVRSESLDRRSDVFAIGTLLYEMCTGQRLFAGESDFSTLEMVRSADVPSPSTLNPEISAQLEGIILRALARKVAERYQWASDLQEDLLSYLGSQQPIFNAKSLATTLCDLFAVERSREQALMEQHHSVSMENYASQAPAEQQVVSFLEDLPDRPPPPGLPPLPQVDTDEDETLLGDDFPAMTPGGAPAAHETGQSGAASVDPAAIAAQPTYVFSSDQELAPGGAEAVLSGPTMILAGNQDLSTPDATLQDLSAPGATAPGMSHPEASIPEYSIPVMMPPRRRSLAKDILIGVLVALLVVMGLFVWRVISKRSQGQLATLVVSTVPPSKVEVQVGSKVHGTTEVGKPLKVDRLAAGPQQVVVRDGKGLIVGQREATLRPGEVTLLSIPLAQVKTAGALELTLEPDDVEVKLNGELVEGSGARRSLRLKAAVTHAVEVAREGYLPERFDVTVQGGEQQQRQVVLKRQAPQTMTVGVKSEPGGATIRINGDVVGKAPLSKALKAGRHRVTAQLPGYRTRGSWAEGKAGESLIVKLTLRRSGGGGSVGAGGGNGGGGNGGGNGGGGAAKPRGKGYLVANTVPWAKVLVDGKDTGKTTPILPTAKFALPAGRHKVTFVAGDKSFHFPVVIRPGKVTRLIKKLPME